MENPLPRIKKLLQQLQLGIYEKNTETSLALLAALAGESILLLGPPGVAKSMVARRLKSAFKEARSFEYLMSRFSTPDEIFGPVSISKLKENDKYERATEGFLPTADVVFLDEIWKAGPAIQNTLLTVMNERIFRNGDQELHLPLKLLVAASNELPAKGEGLEALWDRFIVRLVCRSIQDEQVFCQMLTQADTDSSQEHQPSAPISEEEYASWQSEARKVNLSPELLAAISEVRKQLQHVELEGSELARRIYVSDRRWVHIARLLRTSAFLQGRPTASPADLLPMRHCLWNEPDEQKAVQQIVLKALFAPLAQQLGQLAASVKADLRAHRAKDALAKAVRENDHRDDDLLIVDRLFYQIENHGTGHSYVFITDFKRMPQKSLTSAPVRGIIYKDTGKGGKCIIRLFSPELMSDSPQADREQVTLCRDNDHIYINGVAFKMRHKGAAVMSPATGQIGDLFGQTTTSDTTPTLSYDHYESDVEELCTHLDQMQQQLKQNLFANAEDLAEVESYLQKLYQQVALCRVDIRKLLYNE